MNWHIDTSTLDRYATGDLHETAVFSVEAHLLACSNCRGTLSSTVDRERIERIWSGVDAAVDESRASLAERLLTACGVPGHTARLLAATPSLHPSWILAIVATLGFAVLAAHSFSAGDLPFLILAPLVPVVGIASVYAHPADPTWEIGAASPTGGFRLTMIRTAAVLSVSVVVAGLASFGLPELGWTAAAWLLPSLGLTALTLALSASPASTMAVAGGVGLAWAVAVAVAGRLAADPLAAFGPGGQILLAAIAVVSCVAVVGRRESYERPSRAWEA
jgi:hypothetical protein